METIVTQKAQTIKLSLNRSKVSLSENVSLVLSSPSRVEITIEKALTELGSGFFSIHLTASESNKLIDDTYSYTLTQGDNTLKTGYVRRIEGTLEDNGGELDSELDFILA